MEFDIVFKIGLYLGTFQRNWNNMKYTMMCKISNPNNDISANFKGYAQNENYVMGLIRRRTKMNYFRPY